MRLRSLFVAGSTVLALCVTTIAHAAPPVYVSSVKFHAFDDAIAKALGYASTSILYLREIASVTEEQRRVRAQYESIGCHPFYVMLNGKAEESGYDCRSFYCVGYTKGPKQCEDVRGLSYGGVVEINRRLGLVTIQDVRKLYTEYAPEDRTEGMKQRIAEMEAIKCYPYFIQEFDIVVGDGYQCTEIGKYPRYSGNFTCVTDTRNTEGQQCSIQLRTNELQYRAELMATASGGVLSSSSASSVQSSGGAVSSVASSIASSAASSVQPVTFPDVEQGKYGYTAIVSLATRGIIKGYADGTFKPNKSVNRAEFMQLLVLGVHPVERKGDAWCFPDVVADWYSEAVCAGKRLGWVTGYTDKKFHPERTIRKSEAIKIIVSSLGLPIASGAPLPAGVTESAWYTPYVRKAVELKILLEPGFVADAEVTRADTAVWMYRALKVKESL